MSTGLHVVHDESWLAPTTLVCVSRVVQEQHAASWWTHSVQLGTIPPTTTRRKFCSRVADSLRLPWCIGPSGHSFLRHWPVSEDRHVRTTVAMELATALHHTAPQAFAGGERGWSSTTRRQMPRDAADCSESRSRKTAWPGAPRQPGHLGPSVAAPSGGPGGRGCGRRCTLLSRVEGARGERRGIVRRRPSRRGGGTGGRLEQEFLTLLDTLAERRAPLQSARMQDLFDIFEPVASGTRRKKRKRRRTRRTSCTTGSSTTVCSGLAPVFRRTRWRRTCC